MSEFKARIVAELDTAKLNQQIKELQGKNINLNVKTDTATKNVGQVDKAVKQTTKSAETFGQKLKNAFKISTVYSIAYKAINSIRQAANNAVNSVKELNQSLTNLRIVTNANQNEAEVPYPPSLNGHHECVYKIKPRRGCGEKCALLQYGCV